MRSFIRSGVVKSDAVAVSFPRLVENDGFVSFNSLNFVEQQTDETHIDMEQYEKSLVTKGANLKDTKTESCLNLELILKEAEAKAKEIIANAEQDAKDLRQNTLKELEELKQKVFEETSQTAYEEGFAKGLEEGTAQGYESGISKGTKEAEKIKGEAKKTLELVTRLLTTEYRKVDGALLHLARKMAERILSANLDIHPEFILSRIRALSAMPEVREGLKLYLSPQEFEWVNQLPSNEKPDILICSDDKLKPGDCYLTCLEGIFEAEVEAELDLFEKVLREEIEYGRLEQAGR